jgi:hypothetical protein
MPLCPIDVAVAIVRRHGYIFWIKYGMVEADLMNSKFENGGLS